MDDGRALAFSKFIDCKTLSIPFTTPPMVLVSCEWDRHGEREGEGEGEREGGGGREGEGGKGRGKGNLILRPPSQLPFREQKTANILPIMII